MQTAEHSHVPRERNSMKNHGFNTSKETGSGWDYWSRVYSEDIPQNTNQTSGIQDIRISDMFASEKLVRAKLLFLNVPGLPTGHKNIILNLLKRELHEEMPIQDVIVLPGKWYIHFYRPEDALRVLQYFNGFTFRLHALAVRFCYPDGTFGDESALSDLVECTTKSKNQLLARNENCKQFVGGGVWNVHESESLLSFERELIELLKNHSCLPYHTAIATVRNEMNKKSLPAYFITDAVTQWTTGFVRIFSRNIKIVGNTLCLASGQFYNQRISDMTREGVNNVHRDSWEPCSPDQIRSDIQIKQYACSFLTHFGPQNIQIDIPLRLFAQSLRGVFPKTGYELAKYLTKLSAGFVIINKVLYLSSYERHYGFVIDNLSAYQEDSDHSTYSTFEMEHEVVDPVPIDRM